MSVCKIEKDDSKWRNISEQGEEKAELVGYELNIGERICSKCYNSYIYIIDIKENLKMQHIKWENQLKYWNGSKYY